MYIHAIIPEPFVTCQALTIKTGVQYKFNADKSTSIMAGWISWTYRFDNTEKVASSNLALVISFFFLDIISDVLPLHRMWIILPRMVCLPPSEAWMDPPLAV